MQKTFYKKELLIKAPQQKIGIANNKKDIEKIGLKALVASSDVDRELIILVVGETARRDRFSLNGYKRKTNPLL